MTRKFLNIYTTFLFALVAYAFLADIVVPILDQEYEVAAQEQTAEIPFEKEEKQEKSNKEDLKKKMEDSKFCNSREGLNLYQGNRDAACNNEKTDLFHSHYQEVLSPPPDQA